MEPWWFHFDLIRIRSPAFIGVPTKAVMQVADVNDL
jgi:hypothetical protein